VTDSPAAPPGESGHILIVDDEPLNVDYLEQELESQGFTTESAANGVEALERVAASPPDLVLLDVMMPELDGIATLRILKQDPDTSLIPVVLMTALNAVEDRVRGIEAGADDFLSKPVDDREVLARIRTAIGQKRVIDRTLGELRRTSVYLERFGRQERDVSVLAVRWRPADDRIPEAAVGFVVRRQREVAEELAGAFGGLLSEGPHEPGSLVAVFDGPDRRGRSIAAIEAALAILGPTDPGPGPSRQVLVSGAVTAGRAVVGSTRTGHGGEVEWAWGATGAPVERASAMARQARVGQVAVSGEVAAVVRDRFVLRPVGDDVYGVPLPAEGVADAARAAPVRRVTTILVTDVVGSTSTVERVGDRAGGELLAAHERVTRSELVPHGGKEINTAGDGFVAAFDSPAAAIRCALAVQVRVRELGLVIRAGVHTGELEDIEGVPRGIVMHVAARIAARAAPGEVLVSATTREVAAGAGLAFVERGEYRLRGLSDPRQLYAAIGERTEPASTPPAPPGTPGAGLTSLPAGLTAREVDVLRLVAAGLSDAQVAAQLFLSVRTVNAHLRSIYRKAGVRSRAAAGRFAEENGLM
jgi:DNA-binding NarL/FixJ family response regulator